MDYDQTEIPAAYDLGRHHGPAVTALWMAEIGRRVAGLPVRTILDLGCGTGRFSNALATHFHARLIGIDPSTKMLAQARSKLPSNGVSYACSTGEAIALSDTTVDLVFISMVFHHFSNSSEVARECRRVLRPAGQVFIRAATAEQIPAYPYVPFIPASRSLLEDRLPHKKLIREVFEAEGFKTTAVDEIVQEIAPTYAAYAEKLAAGGDSILASLTAHDFKHGLDAIREHAAKFDPQPVFEPIDVFVFR